MNFFSGRVLRTGRLHVNFRFRFDMTYPVIAAMSASSRARSKPLGA